MSAQNSVTITTDDVMTVAQAAVKLGKHITTIYRWIESGELMGVKLGGVMLVPTSQVERLNRQPAEVKK